MAAKLFKWIAAAFTVGFLICIALLIWLSWPNTNTLVRHSAHNDISGISRDLFLGVDINGFAKWGWHGEFKRDSPLTSAAQSGNSETVRFLLSKGADPNLEDGSHTRPLCVAARCGRLDICKILVEAGAKVFPPESGMRRPKKTAIEWAVNGGFEEVVEYLKAQPVANRIER